MDKLKLLFSSFSVCSFCSPFLFLFLIILFSISSDALGQQDSLRHIRGLETRIHDVHLMTMDEDDCPDCSSEDISMLEEVVTKYQGMRGLNPSAPSSYNLIGKHKFSGTAYSITNPFFGENWYPIRTEKQTLTGNFYSFSISNYGDESDWNINLLPDPGFESFVSDAIPYRGANWYASADWIQTSDGHILVEAEITPDEHRYGNPWFTNNDSKSSLLNKKLTVYGPFIREEAHGNHPEIHPCEQIWWTEPDNALMVMLLVDDSNRFKRRADTTVIEGNQPRFIGGDFSARRVTSYNYKPWALEKNQESELSVAFEFDPVKDQMFMGVQAIDALNFYKDASYPDVTEGNQHTLMYKGRPAVTVAEDPEINPFVGVRFRNVCYNRTKGILQGYVVFNTSIGNGNGKEGFVVLRVDRQKVSANSKPTLFTGDIANTWKQFGLYDKSIPFSAVISSDQEGKGIVDGLIDFNGNGKTDLFAKDGSRWMVMYDGKGTWQELNTSSIPVEELRFGDVNGDRITDIIRVNPRNKVEVSYGGKSQWTEITDAGEQNKMIQVGDFNGDGKTDIVYVKYRPNGSPGNLLLKADMYVKYSCKGSWKKLNSNYNLFTNDDYAANFRFGNFNGDDVTDIFRNIKGKFCVYWNGTGDFKELFKPDISFRMDDLLFVTGLTNSNTDVIYVNPQTKQWTVFYGGRAGSLPLSIKFNDPSMVRFGDLDSDPAVEPFTQDFAEQSVSPEDMKLNILAKAEIQPAIVPRLVPGSLKRVKVGDKDQLAASFSVNYFPGSNKHRSFTSAFQSVRYKTSSQILSYVPKPNTDFISDSMQTIGVLENVLLPEKSEKEIEFLNSGNTSVHSFKIEGLSIIGLLNDLKETEGDLAKWETWKTYISKESDPAKSELLISPPSPPVTIKNVEFELLPFYSSREEKSSSFVEVDDVSQELNDLAYQKSDKSRDLFGDKVFNIKWEFKLKDLTSGSDIPFSNNYLKVSDGKWSNSKVSLKLPVSENLIQVTAKAVITDNLGNVSASPAEFIFYNQHIVIQEASDQIENWLSPLKETYNGNIEEVFIKSNYLSEDNILTPLEVASILMKD